MANMNVERVETFRMSVEKIMDVVNLPDGTMLVDKNDSWYRKKANGLEQTDFSRNVSLIPFVVIGAKLDSLGLKAIMEKVKPQTEVRKRGVKSETLSISQIISANGK